MPEWLKDRLIVYPCSIIAFWVGVLYCAGPLNIYVPQCAYKPPGLVFFVCREHGTIR